MELPALCYGVTEYSDHFYVANIGFVYKNYGLNPSCTKKQVDRHLDITNDMPEVMRSHHNRVLAYRDGPADQSVYDKLYLEEMALHADYLDWFCFKNANLIREIHSIKAYDAFDMLTGKETVHLMVHYTNCLMPDRYNVKEFKIILTPTDTIPYIHGWPAAINNERANVYGAPSWNTKRVLPFTDEEIQFHLDVFTE